MQRSSRRLLLVALLVGLLGLIPGRASGDDVRLEIQVTATANGVRITGVLNDGDRPVAGQQVIASIDGAEIGSARTRPSGRFTFEESVRLSGGSHTATVRFDGSDAIAAATTSQEFTASPSTRDTALTAAGPDGVVNGEMASISGRLTSDGVALAGAGITLSDASGDVEDSFAVTDESGNFQTLYLVPEEQAEGDLEVTLEFEGDGAWAASSASVTMPVTRLELESASATAVASTPTQTPSATPTPEARTAEPTTAPATEATTTRGNSALSPFVITLLGVAALSVGALAFMVYKAGFGRHHSHATTGGLSFLNDDVVAPEPRHLQPPSPDADPTPDSETPAKPRRGLPED